MSRFNLTQDHLKTVEARRETAKEWFEKSPHTSEELADFYRQSQALPQEIEAWHQEPTRASWSQSIVELALKTDRTCAIDIGCGMGHDLEALRDAGLIVCGIEPNETMRAAVREKGIPCRWDFSSLDGYDLILCMDVLEHLPNPNGLLNRITLLAESDAILVEHTPTWDLNDVLHLTSNYGWTVEEHIGPEWRNIGRPDWPVGCWQRL